MTRKKLVATANRRDGVYNRTGKPSVTFCERGGARKRADGLSFCRRQKNKSEQSGLCSDVGSVDKKDTCPKRGHKKKHLTKMRCASWERQLAAVRAT